MIKAENLHQGLTKLSNVCIPEIKRGISQFTKNLGVNKTEEFTSKW